MRYIVEVSSRALPGRDAEYERWYGEIHIGEVLALPGFESVERFRRLSAAGEPTGEFVALYTVDTEDPASVVQSLFAAAPTMKLTDAIDPESPRFHILQPTG